MGVFNGLEGVKRKDVEARFFDKVSEVDEITQKGMAATTASTNGSIVIWMDDDKFLRGEVSVHFSIIDKAVFKTKKQMKDWCKDWLIKIK